MRPARGRHVPQLFHRHHKRAVRRQRLTLLQQKPDLSRRLNIDVTFSLAETVPQQVGRMLRGVREGRRDASMGSDGTWVLRASG